MKSWLILLSANLIAAGLSSIAVCATPTTILQTANYPVTGVLSGQGGFALLVSQFQFPAVRFTLTQATQITAIGGNLVSNGSTGNSEIFGAIAMTDASTTFPGALPTVFQPIAETTFIPPNSDAKDTIVPLSAILAPGNYALIFGSGRFGATGEGGMPFMSGDIGNPSYFIGQINDTTGANQNWNNGDSNLHNIRFVVIGNVVPEPSTFALAALGAVALLSVRRVS